MAAYLLVAERTTFIAVFGLAVFGKVRGVAAFRSFVAWLGRLLRLRDRTGTVVGALLVSAELAAVGCLLFPGTARLGLALACGLLLVFIAVVLYAIQAGVLTECRCFGGAGALMSYPLILRNLLMIALAAPGAAMASPPPATEPVHLFLAVACGLAFAVMFVRGYDMAAEAVLNRLAPPPAEFAAPSDGEGDSR